MTARPPLQGRALVADQDDAGTPGPWVLIAALLGGGIAWSLHLLASYVLVAFSCATRWQGARPALVMISVVALMATGASARLAWTRWHTAREVDRPDDDSWDARMGERTARVSFLMVVGLVSAVLFAVGIVYEALVIWFVPLCEPGVVS